jgi:YVTN family beta-propeller protein
VDLRDGGDQQHGLGDRCRANRVVANILADLRPRAAAFSPDGARAYVTNEVSGTLVVVDTRTHQVLRSVELERGEGKPVGVVVSPDGARVYVANGMASVVSVLDARTLRQVARIPVARRP